MSIGGLPARFSAAMLAQTSKSLDEYIDTVGWGHVQLAEPPRSGSPKGFMVQLVGKGDQAALHQTPRGFGALGKYLAYYVPHSIELLLLKLLNDLLTIGSTRRGWPLWQIPAERSTA